MVKKAGISRASFRGKKTDPLRPLFPGYLPHSLGRLMNLLNYKLMDYLRPLDMTPQQFRVLQVLFKKGMASIGELSTDVVVEQSVISRIVDQLEEKGFAYRQRRSGNARVVEVRPTEEGATLIKMLQPYAQEIIAETFHALKDREAEQLLDMIDRMFRHLSEVRLRTVVIKPPYSKVTRTGRAARVTKS